jgi:hypothetical protein
LFGAPGWTPSPPKKTDVCHDVYENTRTYRKFEGLEGNCILLEIKDLSLMERIRCRKKGRLKNGGISHDVVENKCRKNAGVRVSHDMYENKRLILSIPRCI